MSTEQQKRLPKMLGYKDMLGLWETDCGRACGWYVELDGVVVAKLEDAQHLEMFWDSYRITPVVNDVMEEGRLFSREFWDDFRALTFRNIEYDVCVDAFPAASPLTDDGRVVMRGLYLKIRNPNGWDWLVLKWRAIKKWAAARSDPS